MNAWARILDAISSFFRKRSSELPSAEPAGLVPLPAASPEPKPQNTEVNQRYSQAPISWISGMDIDADGAPRAYAFPEDGLTPLDHLANAGEPGNWFGVITDSGRHDGLPVKQGPNDPAPGYLISTTALQDHTKAITDPRRYVDSATIPYIVVPHELLKQGVQLGDLCVVEYRGAVAGAIVADVGPEGKLGEGSIALAQALGIPSSPKNGGTSFSVKYTVFPGTSKGWVRHGIDTEAKELARTFPSSKTNG